ncbi:O-methyltransferase [Salimicrobium halophilum]|uniref:Predicted O-methyltransferase YrrM n=1 Tax=Salimicrobium halophilum TaxID=86666 RepID=A0A1G8UXQ0_9BACI|nr:O-methyltransferase [Salimicrobium halophilum]SDJ58414.1 Predicted O-methyltransferase YrrM [Salimicrobium halophilum]
MKKINEYIDETFTKEDELLQEVRYYIAEKEMPAISVSPSAGKCLTMLVRMTGAKRVLEIGALGGYSGVCLARGFGAEGELLSLELEKSYAQVAKENLTKAGFEDQVSHLTGPALESLDWLNEQQDSFDFFFIDADKDNYENYLEGCLRLARPGAVIVADNVLARGSVADEEIEARKYTETMRDFNKKVAEHPRLESMLLPIGDGFTVSRVKK